MPSYIFLNRRSKIRKYLQFFVNIISKSPFRGEKKYDINCVEFAGHFWPGCNELSVHFLRIVDLFEHDHCSYQVPLTSIFCKICRSNHNVFTPSFV